MEASDCYGREEEEEKKEEEEDIITKFLGGFEIGDKKPSTPLHET